MPELLLCFARVTDIFYGCGDLAFILQVKRLSNFNPAATRCINGSFVSWNMRQLSHAGWVVSLAKFMSIVWRTSTELDATHS